MRTLALVVCLLAVARAAEAQSCMGAPIEIGNFAAGGGVRYTTGEKGFWLGVNSYRADRLAWSASVGQADIDGVPQNVTELGASVAYVLAAGSQFAACPFVSGSYGWWSDAVLGESAGYRLLSGTAGVGVGINVPMSNGASLAIFGAPGFTYLRSKNELMDETTERNSNHFGATVGLGLNLGRVFFASYGSFTSEEGTDPLFGARIGFTVD
ncbi:MAG TPA: hypothetical protein VNZ57_03595 [Longimicrobiales bacterium]|nr:hypothetical protein [Longimicrobiales bacterium]